MKIRTITFMRPFIKAVLETRFTRERYAHYSKKEVKILRINTTTYYITVCFFFLIHALSLLKRSLFSIAHQDNDGES